ncbi:MULTISPECIES: SusC/RagA family TonB-linked outer membrane protein [Sphingobacterium]|uniref:SusC/RagA family TonB-linked outer membrane protein n=1 Tax=Sphingobacterium TaxID=28453 RepID=UPI00257F57A7|nr:MULTISPECIES: SusC/RagA family TonB-linked outer membrane protein [Sphingobacterium]
MYTICAKAFLRKRFFSTFLISSMMQLGVQGMAQSISLSERNVEMSLVFEKIKTQAGIDFVVSTDVLKATKPVSIQVNNMSLSDVLHVIFKDQPIEYTIEDKFVVLRKKRPQSSATVIVLPKQRQKEITIVGRVLDNRGRALSGATVSVKGSNQGSITSSSGHFSIASVPDQATVIVSYTGYVKQELIAAESMGDILMEIAVGNLDEVNVVVNTGYQKIKPEQSTGAIAQMTTKEFESRISSNFLDGLVNRLPGLMINNDVNFSSTVPGQGQSSRPLFNIRGISTMSANQSPLIVVDGYPTELTLDMIDPNEIASVTILKDAAAATVYGVRASNGVIVIDRKQAKSGAPSFNFRTTWGFKPEENFSRYRWDKQASAITSNYVRERQSLLITPATWSTLFTPGSGNVRRQILYYIQAQLAAGMISAEQAENSFNELASYDNLSAYNRLFLRTALTQTHTLNISGGAPNALYYITANYTSNRENKIRNDNSRLQLTGRTTLKLAKKLRLELTTEFQESRNNGAPVPDAAQFPSYEPYLDKNGNPAAIIAQSYAPVYNNFIMSQGLLDQNYYPVREANAVSDKTRTLNNKTIANFTFNIGNGFDLLFGGIYETSRSESRHLALQGSSEVNSWVNNYTVTSGAFKRNIPDGDFLRQRNTTASSYTARMQLNYNKRIGKHSFNGIAGGEMRNVLSKGNLASYFGYNDQSLLHQPVDYAAIFSGAATVRGTLVTGNQLGSLTDFFDQVYNEDRYLSAFSNIVYAYDNRYSLSGSIRFDQSNLFGTNPKYKYRPLWSMGAAWNMHKEPFLSDIDWLNQLKLRAAFGFNGNVAKLSLPQAIAVAGNNYQNTPTLSSLNLVSNANSSLRWEKTQNLNIGLDYNIFKNISGSVDYYTKKTTDVMGASNIDPTLGANLGQALVNFATIRNNGLEISLKADWIARESFNWNSGLVIAKNTSKVLDVSRTGSYNPQVLDVLGYVNGYPVGAMFSYNTIGLNNEGHPIILDNQGKEFVVNTSSTVDPLVKAMSDKDAGLVGYSGTTVPTINAGLSNRVDVGNFYFFIMLNYYGGFNVRVPRPSPNNNRPLEGGGNYWRNPGDELKTDIPALVDLTSANPSWAYLYNDNYVVHGDYLTIGDVTASYRLNNLVIKRAGFKNFEIKGQVSNLYTIGFNRYNFSKATGNYAKSYVTPTYTIGLFTNF